MKFTALWRIQGRRDVSRKNDPLLSYFGIWNRYRRKQSLCIGMQRRSIKLIFIGDLDEVAKVHNANAIADVLDNAEVVSDKNIG